VLPQLTESVLVAFIVAVALAELSRAALAPLPDLGELLLPQLSTCQHQQQGTGR
jgi:hypothetical protein